MNDAAKAGARSIITDCLGLSPGAIFVLLIDETSLEMVDPFFMAARESDIRLTALFYSLFQQRSIDDLGSLAKNALADADAALLAHTAADDCSRFRTKLVSDWRGKTRLGTMPGANLSILEIASRVDYKLIVEQCRKLTPPLLNGKECTVTTYDRLGKSYELHLRLGGVDRVPVQSTGVVGPNAWGNVPSGEIFTAPFEDSADGEFLVNGSIGTFLVGDNEALLVFREGRLIEHRHLSTGEPVTHLEMIKRLSIERGDENWDVIAELGIGVNNGIKDVTGIPLVDEKIFGTMHIAIGNNIGWQGKNRAQLHLDIITKNPSLNIDGRSILDSGVHVVRPEDFDNLEYYRPHPRYIWPDGTPIAEIAREKIRREEPGTMLVKLDNTHSGRITEVPVSNEQTRRLVASLLRLPGRTPSVTAFIDQESLSPELLQRFLSLLWTYGVIRPAN